MTFYLAPDDEHFDRFFDEVVDKTWLNEPGYHPNARVPAEPGLAGLHRLTYVSCVPEQFQETDNETNAPDTRVHPLPTSTATRR